MGADKIRGDADAVRLVRDFFQAGKPAGVICHGPWTLVEADVVRGRTLTSWPTLATDINDRTGPAERGLALRSATDRMPLEQALHG